MGFFDHILNRRKRLSDMDRSDLRRHEIRMEKERDRMLQRVRKLAREKQAIFEDGRNEKTPEVRAALASQFELKTSEQLMVSRHLNIRSKELLTVSKLRMIRENSEQARRSGDQLGMIGELDVAKIERLIENDAVTSEMYQERLDSILSVVTGVDEGTPGVSAAGQEVLDIWSKLDDGAIQDKDVGFDEADRRVRGRQLENDEL
jgi:hypothetical protein